MCKHGHNDFLLERGHITVSSVGTSVDSTLKISGDYLYSPSTPNMNQVHTNGKK